MDKDPALKFALLSSVVMSLCVNITVRDASIDPSLDQQSAITSCEFAALNMTSYAGECCLYFASTCCSCVLSLRNNSIHQQHPHSTHQSDPGEGLSNPIQELLPHHTDDKLHPGMMTVSRPNHTTCTCIYIPQIYHTSYTWKKTFVPILSHLHHPTTPNITLNVNS